MKLYTFAVAPNPRRVTLFLQTKGLEIPTEEVDLAAHAQFDEKFRAINPRCTVPALVLDDGTVLADVVAICLYLDALHPERPLLGHNELERAQIVGWMHRIFLEGFLAVAEMLRNRGEAFKDRPLPGPLKMPQIPELVERGRVRLQAFFKDVNAHLGSQRYVVGDSLSQADIDLFVVCEFAGWVKESIPAGCDNLSGWHQRIKAELDAA